MVEAVSPSSRGIDRGAKLAGYFELASLRHCLIVDAGRRVVLRHRRGKDGRIAVAILREGTLTLDPPGLTVAVEEIFAKPSPA